MEAIIRRHPFVDGNKRTATASVAYNLLSTFGYEIDVEQRKLEDFAVSVAAGKLETPGIARWSEAHSRKS